DLNVIEGLSPDEPLRIRAYRREGDSKLCFRFKLYHVGGAVPLADVLPILENMGLKALTEDGAAINGRPADGGQQAIWVHEFELEDANGENLVFADIQEPFESAFTAIWKPE